MEMTYSDKAKELKSRCISKYEKADNETLTQGIQAWMNERNAKEGYLPGLSPKCNITKFAEISRECEKCTKHDGCCAVSNILRNVVSSSLLLEILEKDSNIQEVRAESIMALLDSSYASYIMLKEFTKRNCEGTWHSPLLK